MPGREELIQQNAARAAYRSVNLPQPTESVGKSAGTSPATSLGLNGGPKNFFGGNFEVYSKLEGVEFQGVLGDNSMRGGIAYIRLWRRGGTAASVGVSSISGSGGVNSQGGDYLSELNNLIIEAVGGDIESFEGTVETDTSEGYAIITSPDFAQDEDGNIVSGSRQTVIVPNEAAQAQRDLSQTIPITSAERKSPGPLVGSSPSAQRSRVSPFLQSPRSFNSVPFFIPDEAIRGRRSANPNGLVNTLSRAALGAVGFRQSFPSYLQGPRQSPPAYLGGAAGNSSSSVSEASGEMMWQFLFNPSELELEVGPEFKSAEVWGVSDKSNSGQPLHWSHNKNAQLKFNSILLNGFVFGRKVEALEQGIIELFMARDGVGQHGPHILEFVWGKRTFGPCVMKNINIKEKMWDEGEVVNAELSFTLEQVPEWTINDGAYVDVARPGRRPLQEEAAQLGQNTGTQTSTPPPSPSDAATSTPTSNTPGGGSRGNQKSRSPSAENLASICKNIKSDINKIQQVERYINKNYIGSSNFLAQYSSSFPNNYSKYRSIYNQYFNNSLYKSELRSLSPDCSNAAATVKFRWENQSPVAFTDQNFNKILEKCSKSIRLAIQKKYNSNKCSTYEAPSGGRQGPGLF